MTYILVAMLLTAAPQKAPSKKKADAAKVVPKPKTGVEQPKRRPNETPPS